MYRYTITESPLGYEVYINLINSSAGIYVSRRPQIINLIKEVLTPMDLTSSPMQIMHNMGRVIGNSDIVETTEKDTIYYALPFKKKVYGRYAKNRNPSPSSELTIILGKDTEGNYEVHDTWVGPYTPPFPGDEHMTAKSKPFWETHALAQDEHAVQSKSITKDCPY